MTTNEVISKFLVIISISGETSKRKRRVDMLIKRRPRFFRALPIIDLSL